MTEQTKPNTKTLTWHREIEFDEGVLPSITPYQLKEIKHLIDILESFGVKGFKIATDGLENLSSEPLAPKPAPFTNPQSHFSRDIPFPFPSPHHGYINPMNMVQPCANGFKSAGSPYPSKQDLEAWERFRAEQQRQLEENARLSNGKPMFSYPNPGPSVNPHDSANLSDESNGLSVDNFVNEMKDIMTSTEDKAINKSLVEEELTLSHSINVPDLSDQDISLKEEKEKELELSRDRGFGMSL